MSLNDREPREGFRGHCCLTCFYGFEYEDFRGRSHGLVGPLSNRQTKTMLKLIQMMLKCRKSWFCPEKKASQTDSGAAAFASCAASTVSRTASTPSSWTRSPTMMVSARSAIVRAES